MKKRISMLVALSLMMSQTVFASRIDKIEKDIAGASVSFTGSEFNPKEAVNVRILYPDVTAVSDGKQNKTIAWMGEAKVLQDGTISVTAKMPESTDKKVVSFSLEVIEKDDTKTVKPLVWIDNEGLSETVSNIQNAESADEAMAEIVSKAEVLEIEFLEPWENFSDSQKEKVGEALYESRADFELFNDYLSELNYLIFVESLYSAESEEEFFGLLEKYEDMTDSSLYEGIYEDMSDETKAEFESCFFQLRKELDGIKASFSYAFKEALLKAYIKTLDRSYPLIEVLEGLKEVLINEDADMADIMDDFEAADEEEKLKVCEALLEERETELSAVCEIINDALNEKTGDESNKGSSSGGGGSSSGKKTNYSVPASITGVNTGNVQAQTQKLEFSDVLSSHYAYESIYYLAENGVISGYSDNGKNIFNPDGEMTREQFVKMILLAFNFEILSESYGFSDVPENSWYADYVNTAAKLGIINGVGENMFGAGEKITREQMCTIIYRVASLKNIEISGNISIEFKDNDKISDYAFEAVTALKSAGVVSGDDGGSFNPQGNATRANAAKVLHKVIAKV